MYQLQVTDKCIRCTHIRLGLCCRWAFHEGQDFLQDHNTSNIDFAAFHAWPDNWLDNSTSFETDWIAQHISDAAALGKPVSFSARVSLLFSLEADHAACQMLDMNTWWTFAGTTVPICDVYY